MQDESGFICYNKSASSSGSSSRQVKRSKSLINTPRSSGAVSAVTSSIAFPCSEDISCLDPNGVLVSQQGTAPYGDFQCLSPEVIFYILDYMPLKSIGHLGQTSKAFRDILIQWMDTKRMQSRLVQRMSTARIPTMALCSTTLFPPELHNECNGTGLLIKLLTCLFPTRKRLRYFHSFMQNISNEILQRDPSHQTIALKKMIGLVLHSFIAGWDKKECTKVFNILNHFYNIAPLLADTQIKFSHSESTLRMFVRTLYLDFSPMTDRSMWLDIIFSPFYSKKTQVPPQVAKLLLLLNAPLDDYGDFALEFCLDEDAEYHLYLENYVELADTLARLTSPGAQFASETGLELLQLVFSVPGQWSSRAISCLLLCLQSFESKLVKQYFETFAMSQKSGKAIEMLTDIVYISNEFISSELKGGTLINARTVFNLIRNAINCSWSKEEQKQICCDLSHDIKELSIQFHEDAIATGSMDDFLSFLESWKDVNVHMYY